MHLRPVPLRHFCTAIPLPPGFQPHPLVFPTAAALRRPHSRPQTASWQLIPSRRLTPFSTTSHLLKHKTRRPSLDAPSPVVSSATDEEPPPYSKKPPKRSLEHAAALSSAALDDPYDVSALEGRIAQALAELQDALSQLRTGGRFNTDLLEGLRVGLVKGSKESVRLGDVAQVLPRGGRSVCVLVGESEHTKPIISAILASPHSLTPVPAPNAPLELHIPLPPPTQASRLATLAQASKVGEVAAQAVRFARGAQQKVLRAMELARTVRPDDLKRGRERMEKVVEGGSEEVKRRVEEARRGLSV